MNIAIVDYGIGNIKSIQNAFDRLNLPKPIVTNNFKKLTEATGLILPGVGAFSACSQKLRLLNMFDFLTELVIEKKKPILGICVGMQLMAIKSYEYQETEGLGWIDGEVRKIKPKDRSFKIPHMGWNALKIECKHPILNSIHNGDHVYFVHSFQMTVKKQKQRLAYTDYGTDITAVVSKDNMVGLQFHPEKSGQVGLKIIENFLSWSP